MSKVCLRPMAAFVAFVYLGVSAWSQSLDTFVIRGEIRSDQPTGLHDHWVELIGLDRTNDTARVDVQFDGAFQIRNVRPGTYTLRVTSLDGSLVHQEMVTIVPQNGILTVRLPAAKREPLTPGTVSITQLQHPPARKAFQAVLSAQRFSESGQPAKAVEELEKAIRISPEYADAYNNLAVQHIRLGRYDEAAGELERAIEIAGPNPLLLTNLAFTRIQLDRIPEAATAARAALRLDGGFAQAHLILGSILAVDPRTLSEALPHLEFAAKEMPAARTLLERVRGLH